METSNFIHLGTRHVPYNGEMPFGISEQDRFNHLHIIGQTGTGKTSLMKRLAIDDIQNGHGLAIFDLHGKAALELLEYVPPERMRDVVYLDPSDHQNCFGLNLLQSAPPHERNLITQQIVGTFRYRWADSWGDRMDWIFKNTVRALLDHPTRYGATLLAVPRMFEDQNFRNAVTAHIKNDTARSFWLKKYPSWSKQEHSKYTLPVINKVEQFNGSDILRNIIGQSFSTIDIQHIMDNRRILIINFNVGQIGEDDANLLGSILVTALYLAALKRSLTDEKDLIPFFCYLDEFHSFTTRSFLSMFSLVRQYKLGLIIAHQYLDQVHKDVLSAVLGNAGTTIAFRVSGDDADTLSKPLGLPASEIAQLGRGEIAVRCATEGTTNSFFGKALQPPLCHGNADRLIAYSTKRYTKPLAEVSARIERWQNDNRPRRKRPINKGKKAP